MELVFKGEVGVGSHLSKFMGQLPWCAVGYAREAIGRGERGGPILETVLGPPLLLCAKHVCSHMNVQAPTDQNNQPADQKKPWHSAQQPNSSQCINHCLVSLMLLLIAFYIVVGDKGLY